MLLTFKVDAWTAWSPSESPASQNVAEIPAMLRRRLSPLARAAVSVMLPLINTFGAMPLVYVSRHGDLNRTVELLMNLAKREPLSPTAFSLSVHNAAIGLFSIHQGLTENITALSCGPDELVPALIECLGLCQQETPKVLCVFCDEPPPAIYGEQATQPLQSYALAMVISQGDEWSLSTDYLSSPPEQGNPEPQGLQWHHLLENHGATMSLNCNGIRWQLARNDS